MTMNTLPKRIQDKITVNEDGCWMWTASLRNGYGQVKYKGKNCSSHKLVWTLIIGQVTNGLVLDHYRMNEGERNSPCSKLCCNPGHLEVVTYKTNSSRGRTGANSALKTHCPSGHEYSVSNTYVRIRKNGDTSRECRICRKESNALWYKINR
jgi:hypothetical protein